MMTRCIRLCYLTLVWSAAAAAPHYPPIVHSAVAEQPEVYMTSWYGPRYHGRLTANGEVYDMHQLTAAHRELPFGTRLRVVRPEDGRSVVVRINDRGPFIPGRDLDLSLAAARELGIERQGLAWVRYELINN